MFAEYVILERVKTALDKTLREEQSSELVEVVPYGHTDGYCGTEHRVALFFINAMQELYEF